MHQFVVVWHNEAVNRLVITHYSCAVYYFHWLALTVEKESESEERLKLKKKVSSALEWTGVPRRMVLPIRWFNTVFKIALIIKIMTIIYNTDNDFLAETSVGRLFEWCVYCNFILVVCSRSVFVVDTVK